MDRRSYLATACAAISSSVAGCQHLGYDGYATMQAVEIVTTRDDAVKLERLIERADTDEVVHYAEYVVPGNLEGFGECVWPDEPLTIHTRLDGGDWSRISTTDRTGCLFVLVEVNENGTSLYAHSGDCPVDAAACHVDEE